MEDRRNRDETAEAPAVDHGYALAERVRTVTFRQARRGYDRREVDDFLAQLADALRTAELGTASPPDEYPDALRQEVERVGESTAAILRAAEQSAREIRGGAKRDAEELRRSAEAEVEEMSREAEEAAASLREAATQEAGRVRLKASEEAEETQRSAQVRAESLVADAIQRRRMLESRIERLMERREVLLEDLGRLTAELQDLVASQADEDLLLPAEAEDAEQSEEGKEGEERAGVEPQLEELEDRPLGEVDIAGEPTQEYRVGDEPESVGEEEAEPEDARR